MLLMGQECTDYVTMANETHAAPHQGTLFKWNVGHCYISKSRRGHSVQGLDARHSYRSLQSQNKNSAMTLRPYVQELSNGPCEALCASV